MGQLVRYLLRHGRYFEEIVQKQKLRQISDKKIPRRLSGVECGVGNYTGNRAIFDEMW